MEYSRRQLADILNNIGYRTRNNTYFTNTTIAPILKKLKIKYKKLKMINYIDKKTRQECQTQVYVYDEEDKNKILRYAKKNYKNINNKNVTTLEINGKQIELLDATVSATSNNSTVTSLKSNEDYYRGAYEGILKMYNELSSKYDNLYAKYSKVLEENKKSFWFWRR